MHICLIGYSRVSSVPTSWHLLEEVYTPMDLRIVIIGISTSRSFALVVLHAATSSEPNTTVAENLLVRNTRRTLST